MNNEPNIEEIAEAITNRAFDDDFKWSGHDGAVIKLSRPNLMMVVEAAITEARASDAETISRLTKERDEQKEKLDYVHKMGLRFGMMKTSDKPEPYLAHVWQEDSDHERMFREWSHSIGWERTVETLTAERDAAIVRAEELSGIIEGERSKCGQAVQAIRKAISLRAWLSQGRGSYEWNDDRWIGEFGQAIKEIETELDKLKPIISDLSYCPQFSQEVTAARLRTAVAEKEEALSTLRAKLAEAEAGTERAEEALRLCCIHAGGFDPSDGEGTSPEEVVAFVEARCKELAEAEKDTKRIYFLNQRVRSVDNFQDGFRIICTNGITVHNPDLRAAIDSASDPTSK